MKKNNGFAIWTVAASVLIFFGAISFSACQNELLDSPSFQNRGSYSTGRVAAPTNLTATQGGFRSITIKWTAAKSAVFYNIYHSDTATGNFTFLEQTPDATCSYTTSADPDVKKYYKIQSVDTNGEVSEQYSQICFGTTLATPIITSIKQNAKGDAITVRWYKGVNCTTDTYLNDSLNYTIVLYNADGTQVLREETISAMDVKEAADTKYTFTNLTPNTKYKIQIKAYTKSAQDSKSTESSDKEDQSTAHSLIPAAPENFSVSKGTSKDSVTLSWELPKYAEIKSATAFETRPVYFKIYRKLESAPENAYEPIVTYLGTTVNADQPANDSTIYFEKTKTGESEESIITVTPKDSIAVDYSKADETKAEEAFPSYIPGTIITYIDKNVKSGKKYSYRIQSFIDDSKKKNITSDESICEDFGWLINSPTIQVSSKPNYYNNDNKQLIESFSVTMNFKFDDFGQKYNYIITETCQEMENVETGEGESKTIEKKPVGGETKEKYSSTSYADFFPWKKEYKTEELKENHFKYYSYSVAITSEDGKTEYASIDAPGKIIIIDKKESVPNVDDFSVQDGYSNKFILSWTYDETCSYKVIYTNKDKNGKEESKIEKTFAADELKNEKGESCVTGDKVKFSHQAESGDTRTVYTLVGSNGFESSRILDGEYKTLGTPEPYFEPSYKSIKVIWKPVQKATSYTITATYNKEKIKAENISKIETDENGNFYCVITEPYGETINGEERISNTTNAEIAGNPIDFEIKATSSTEEIRYDSDTITNSNIKISTLGPAATKITQIQGAGKQILLKWNKIEGAKGYIIFRKKYSKSLIGMPDKADVYFYSAEDKSLSLIQDDSTPSASCNETAGLFTFYDKYKEAQNYDSQYETDQAQIAWGLPFGYTVIPVLKDSDFTIDDDLVITGTEDSIAYTKESLDKIEQKGATYGYGLALTASKATSQHTVELNWEPPYGVSSEPMIFRRAYNASAGSSWKLDAIGSSKDIKTIECVPEVNYKAYDYIVCYKPERYEDLTIDPYYEKYLSESVETVNNERNNKGYIFSFAPITASYNGTREGADYKKDEFYYSERVSWNAYDYSERAVGPISCSLEMLNTNKTTGWVKLADIDINNGLVTKTLDVSDNVITEKKYIKDLILDSSRDRMLILSPRGITNKTSSNTDGLLKVLRDSKHYYRIRCNFIDKNGTIVDLPGDTVYAYRQITDEELVKSTMLVIAELIKTSKMMEDYPTGTEGLFGKDCVPVYGYTGSIDSGRFTWSQDSSSKFCWYISNFKQGWDNLPYKDLFKLQLYSNSSVLQHFLSVTDSNSNQYPRGTKAGSTLIYLCYNTYNKTTDINKESNFDSSKKISLSITSNGIPLTSYSGTVKFAAKKTEFSAEVLRNDISTYKTENISGAEEVKKWIPADINGNGYQGKNPDYGWWED